jgi:hypothetical protein
MQINIVINVCYAKHLKKWVFSRPKEIAEVVGWLVVLSALVCNFSVSLIMTPRTLSCRRCLPLS